MIIALTIIITINSSITVIVIMILVEKMTMIKTQGEVSSDAYGDMMMMEMVAT